MKKLMFLMVFVGLIGAAWAQKTVSGVVVDQGGETIPGVSIIVKNNPSVGASTNIDGKFEFQVPDAARTLVVEFMGMKTRELPIQTTPYNIRLEPTAVVMDATVVTALGITREKKALGYSVQEVGGEELTKVKNDNFVNSLSGKVSGLQIKTGGNMGGSTNVVMRGSSSLTGNNQALFVIDGVPVNNTNTNNSGQTTGRSGYDYGNAASDINPNDIASISVLKGAAATALYGSRAANGVILITTKKGTGRAGKKGLGITYSSGANWGKVLKNTFIEYQDQYGAGYGPYYSGGDNPYLSEVDIDGDGTLELAVPVTEDGSYGAAFDPNLMVYHYDAFEPASADYQKARPWVAAENGPITFFETARTLTNSFDISGQNEDGSFRLGYTNYDYEGILPNSHLNRNSISFNSSYNIADDLKITASVNYTNTRGKGRNGTGYSGNLMSNFRQWWQTNVDIERQRELYESTGRNVTWNPSGFGSTSPIFWDNPYWQRFENYQTDERNRILGFTQVDYKITDRISLLGRYSVDQYSTIQEERKAVGSVSGEFGVDRSDETSGYARLMRNYIESNIDLMAKYGGYLNDDLSLDALIGTNLRKTTTDQVYASTNGGLIVPGLYSLSNSVNPMLNPEELFREIAVNGIFTNVSMGYKNLVFVDATLRRDQSSTLPEENNAFFYPSVSTSFLFSTLVDKAWFDLGKLRLNYAEVGNSAPFASIDDTYAQNPGFNGNALFSVPSRKNNVNLMPERTQSLEAGLEMFVWKRRLGLDFAVYKTNTIDQILPVTVSTATGYSSKFINSGEVENKGIELALMTRPIVNKTFSWDLNVNWARNVNKVVSLADGVENLQIGSLQGGLTINARVGEAYGSIQGTDYIYNDEGRRVVDENGQYMETETSDIVIGNINPQWTGGVSNTFSFKNLSASFLIDIQKGGSIFSLDQFYGMGTGLYQETVFTNDLGNPVRNSLEEGGGMILDGVKEDGTENDVRVDASTYATFGWTNRPNSEFIFDASYVKLREVTLSYRIPAKLMAKWPIADASIGLSGSNLMILHKNLKYADPESGQSSGNIQGWQSGALPTTRNIGVNLNVTF